MPEMPGAPSMESTPPSPRSNSRVSALNWTQPSDQGMGPEAANPQVQALQGIKMIEMGAQTLSTAIPELAGPIQQFVQQLAQMVPQMMSQSLTSAPNNMTGTPTPVPPGPSAM